MSTIPFVKVEDAEEEVTFNAATFNPPAKVEVAVDVASNVDEVVVPNTDKALYGEVVPIPTFPPLK